MAFRRSVSCTDTVSGVKGASACVSRNEASRSSLSGTNSNSLNAFGSGYWAAGGIGANET